MSSSPPVPVIIQLDESIQLDSSSSVEIVNSPIDFQSNGVGVKKNLPKVCPPPPVSSSLLGADLFQKPASLAMPPPSSIKVKKARNLVNPGMSMVKWMKLQEARERPTTRKKIPLTEIAKHDKESDCWMVIRNCVYDVTEYLPYHPGGIPELMKGAGKDATALFNEVHRWVNFDSILKSCLKGYLAGEFLDEPERTMEVAQMSLVPKSTSGLPVTKFSENEKLVILQVEMANRDGDDELSEDNWSVSVLNRERFLLKVILKPPELWMAHVKLLQTLRDDSLGVRFQNSCRRAIITLKKPTIGTWKRIGLPLPDNNRVTDSRQIQMDDFCVGTIVEKEKLTHDVIQLSVQPASSTVLGVPVGFHLKIRLPNNEDCPTRKYTPVIKNLPTDTETNSNDINSEDIEVQTNNRLLDFIIKIYPDGQLTKSLGALEVGSCIELGNVAGRYDHTFLQNCSTLALFAGGSGITPFIRIADFLFKRSNTYPISRVLLIFFNHTEDDIIWKEKWIELASKWKNFHFFPVISSCSDSWSGRTGRVTDTSLFESILLDAFRNENEEPQKNLQNDVGKLKAMTCGSSGFNDACVTMLKNLTLAEISITDEDVFLF